ncbi:TRAP transporter large permease [Uliginosibacterium sp. 31-12]|uniref:TRAP transporter large permease n=1 Tax=Uliginosibacterium sp. 31-12 TaxID=3062781 RepID=UPI0026E1B9C6|nr:TRAP transporter large permease [Uliginosibacterium sp. 31-12]MDO6388382.1 TRAP transporter large permease [Uliginosibacterium sp. 31-12]
MSTLSFSLCFLLMIGLMLLGIPIAVTMVLVGAGAGVVVFGTPFLTSCGSMLWGVLNDNLLTAAPLFILLGELLLRSGVADRMYQVMSAWLSRMPGGLLHTNIGCCALFAATSGSSVATAATVGTVALPSLRARNYRMSDALGSLAAGGTLGILIPPSVNMIVYGSLTENSIGRLFMAGIIPGLLLTGSFMLFIYINAILRGNTTREELPPLRERIALLVHLVPPFVIFGIVMGSLYTGIATATESAALGVMAALFFTWRSGRLNMELLENCFLQTARITGMIMLILAAAFVLNLLISLSGVADKMTQSVMSLGLSATAMLLVLIVFYLVLGMFMDVMSMLVATVPITYPIVTALGVDPIWFGIFIILMCELALITPPVGMNLFVVQGIRPDGGGIGDVIRGTLPYVAILILFTLLLIAFPALVTWLPNLGVNG